MKLRPNFEIVGVLSDLREDDGQLKLTFTIRKEIEISTGSIFEEKLQNLLGQRIAILNCDNAYRLRMARKK